MKIEEQYSKQVIDTLNNPVFIVGCPRSGTTWLQRLVVSHPDICGGPESGFFHQFWPILSNLTWDPEKGRDLWLLAYWEKEKLQQRIYDLYIETFAGFVSREKCHIFCEKSPSHALRIADIHNLLPQAKFIHIIRDSRSTVASLLSANRGWGSNWAPKTAKEAAIQWYLHVSKARKQGQFLGDNFYMEIHYEDMKHNTEQALKEVYDFVGVDFSVELLKQVAEEQKFEKQKATGGTRFNVGHAKEEPKGFFNKGQIDSWKKDLTFWEKVVTWRFTRKLMAQCGYSWKGRI